MPRTLGQKRENKITYMNVFQFFPKTAVQRRQHVDVAGCRTFFFSGLISMFVFDILQIPSACSQIYCGCCAPNCAPPGYGPDYSSWM